MSLSLLGEKSFDAKGAKVSAKYAKENYREWR